MTDIPQMEGTEPLSPHHASLAFGVPASTPGTIYALSVSGGIRLGAREERTVVFGRNAPTCTSASARTTCGSAATRAR